MISALERLRRSPGLPVTVIRAYHNASAESAAPPPAASCLVSDRLCRQAWSKPLLCQTAPATSTSSYQTMMTCCTRRSFSGIRIACACGGGISKPGKMLLKSADSCCTSGLSPPYPAATKCAIPPAALELDWFQPHQARCSQY